MDSRKTQRAAESEDWIGWHATALRLGAATDPEAREMQRRLLRDDDLAVIEAMAESLVRSQDVGSVLSYARRSSQRATRSATRSTWCCCRYGNRGRPTCRACSLQ